MRRLTKTLHKVFSPSGKGLGEKGFTLIELLVVIGILAVLAGVVTLSVGQFIGKGKTEALKTELEIMQTAVTAHQADTTGALPATVAELVSDGYILAVPSLATYTWVGGIVVQTAN